jgi:peptidoglycan/LPS O-acetylase OafA/YrhL
MRKSEYDFAKGIAIICVVLLHSISYADLYSFFAPWHIWQAIPIFVIVSGALYAEAAGRNQVIHLSKIRISIYKLIKPAILIWLIQLILIYLIKGSIDERRIIEIFKQGGFGAGGYFVYIAIENILLGGIYFFIIEKYRKLGLLFIAGFSVFFDLLAYKIDLNDEIYRVIATRYAFFYAIGLAYVRGILNFSKIAMTGFWLLGLLWLVLVQYYLFDLRPVYPAWHSHTALSGFVAFGYFIVMRDVYKKFQNLGVVRIICMFGKSSYYIFLVQMTFFWFKRWMSSNNYYPEYGFELVVIELVACLTLGMLYSVFFEYAVRQLKLFEEFKLKNS